jgi:hypothetical protein
MKVRDLYKKYFQCIEALAARPSSCELRLRELSVLLQKLEDEVASLEPANARLLCEELCNQTEYEALAATSKWRRGMLLTVVEGLEQMSFPMVKH